MKALNAAMAGLAMATTMTANALTTDRLPMPVEVAAAKVLGEVLRVRVVDASGDPCRSVSRGNICYAVVYPVSGNADGQSVMIMQVTPGESQTTIGAVPLPANQGGAPEPVAQFAEQVRVRGVQYAEGRR